MLIIIIFFTYLLFGYFANNFQLTSELLTYSTAMSLRFVILMTAFSLFFLTTSPDDLGLALEQSHIPYEFSFAFTTAVRFVPVLATEAQTIMAKEGGIPVGSVDMAAIKDTKIKQLNALFNQIKQNDGLAFYPDWPIPDGWSIFGGAIQELMSGKKSPGEMLEYMSGEYYAYKETL